MQYLNEFLIEVVSLEIEITPIAINEGLSDEDLEELELELNSIDLSHYKERSTIYKNRLEHLRLRSQTEILLLSETGILYQLNRIYIIKEVLSDFSKKCQEVISSIDAFPRDDEGTLLKYDNNDIDRLEMIIIDLLWYMRGTLILSLPENKIPFGLKYRINDFLNLNDKVYGWHTDLYDLMSLRITKLERLIQSIKLMTGIEPKLFASDEEVKKELKLPEKPRTYGLLHSLNASQITALYEALKGKYIASDTTVEQFQSLFDKKVTKMVTPIHWLESNRLLVYLLERIFKRWQTYFERKEAFKNQNDKPLIASDYSTALSDSKTMGFPIGFKGIDKIFETISKQNV